jgi:toxin ParE1/3/4
MKLRVTETAFAELEDLAAYISTENPAAARAVVSRIEQIMQRIVAFPYMARAAEQSSVRVFPVHPFPYLVFYTVEADEIIIRNIRHAARRRPDESE